ncbi:MAG: MBL fold metallo-hydrolase [Mogibacterium sp.]|nr:MBL fold metallo-hydrolase [Mogibacterium sp.]
MKVTFIGATHEVTGSCSLLEVGGKNIIVDCGMEQGADIFENIEIPVAPGDIDAVVLTHAHIDHSGKLPFLVAHGYSGPVYCTEATEQLCRIMLMDSAHIQESEAVWRNRKAERAGDDVFVPLYTTEDVQNTMKLFRPSGYEDEVEVFDGVTVSYTDAGHLLGSSNVLFKLKEGSEERTILFSGDIGNEGKPLIKSPQKPPTADYVVCESTYGNRMHPAKPDYLGNLTRIIQSTLDRGGNLVIPAFAVGRTQEILYYIRIIKEEGLIHGHDGFPVVVDSPLAVEATNIYSTEMYEYYNDEALDLIRAGINPVTFPDLRLSVTSDESKAINDDRTPKVIISASGMCEAGRIRHHLKHNLWRPECTILFAGYQSQGTVGCKLLDGAPTVKLFGEDIQVKAEIQRIESFSSHADQRMLLNWVADASPGTRLFVNHGEDKVTEYFAEEAGKLIGKPAVAPYSGEVWDLITDELVDRAPVVPVIRKETLSSGSGKYNAVYEDLRRAGSGLMDVIRERQGGSNKELKALTKEITKLIEKYRLE